MTDDSRDTFYNSIASLPPANYDPAICKALNYLNEQGEQKAKAVALKFCGAK